MPRTQPLALTLAPAAALLAAIPAAAHEKWFCSHDRIQELTAEVRPEVFTTLNGTLSVILTVTGVAAVLLLLLDIRMRRRKTGERLCRWLLGLRHAAAPLLGVTTGLALVWAALHSQFFAHDLLLTTIEPRWLASVLRISQAGIGACLIVGLATRWVGLLLLVAYLPAFALFGLRSWIDYIDVVGICTFLMIAGRGALSLDRALGLTSGPFPGLDRWAFPILRVFVGINLIVLGINDKFLNPNIAIAVTREHDLNFLAAAGVSDEVFVLLAAATETAVGLLLALGITARITASILLALLTLTAFVFGPVELVGHAPILAAGFAILSTGTGGQLAAPAAFIQRREAGRRADVAAAGPARVARH